MKRRAAGALTASRARFGRWRRRARDGPGSRAPHGVTPILRLIGFVAFAILVVVLLVLWGQGCSSDKKRNDYSDAMTELGTIGANSAKIGSESRRAAHDAGPQAGASSRRRSEGLIQQTAAGCRQRRRPRRSGPAAARHRRTPSRRSQLRVGGMQGLLDTFKATKDDDSKDATAAGEKLAEQARRLEASDVVWQYLFRVPAQATLAGRGPR